MLLTITSRSLLYVKRAKAPLTPAELPEFAAEELGMKGMNVNASLLKGMGVAELERLRDRADRARCPILVLIDEAPLAFGGPEGAKAVDRVSRLGMAASKLGAPSIAVEIADAPADQLDAIAIGVKRALIGLDRFDAHLLLRSGAGLTGDPQRMAELIKKIGGFRIGSMPSFARAAASGDAPAALRRLAPYAQAVEASIKSFNKLGKHEAWSLEECLEAVRAVGYQNTLCIDYPGKTDPVKTITRARELLAGILDPEEAI